jgi:hypothetical protein
MARAPKQCPACGGTSVAEIVRGMPAYDADLERRIEEGRIVLGGCCLSDDDPEWHCSRCHQEWRTPSGKGSMRPSEATANFQRWIWVTRPEYYANEDLSDREYLDPSLEPDAGGWWTCHKNTRRGDLALLYRTRPRSDLKYLVRAESDAYAIAHHELAFRQGWDYGCDFRVLYAFRAPLTLADLRSDPYLEEWGAPRSNFRQRVYRISDQAWSRLVDLIGEREPAARSLLASRTVQAGFVNEKELEDRIAAEPSLLHPSGTTWRFESGSGYVKEMAAGSTSSATIAGGSGMW